MELHIKKTPRNRLNKRVSQTNNHIQLQKNIDKLIV